MPKMIKK